MLPRNGNRQPNEQDIQANEVTVQQRHASVTDSKQV